MQIYKSKSIGSFAPSITHPCFPFKARKNINEKFLSFFSFKTASLQSLSPENIPRVGDASH